LVIVFEKKIRTSNSKISLKKSKIVILKIMELQVQRVQ